MYVCVCNAVTENDIENAVREGITDMPALERVLNVSTCCGCCRETAEACIARATDGTSGTIHSAPA
ncbi:MAG: bacterioferritin [Gammaproteobacteria bacterium]|nr:bacterioferritin [Gammaproteobacteria bacterium]